MKKLTLITLFLLLTAMCPKGTYLVTKITDGDTITVEELDEKVRILGLDTPETRRGKRLRRQAKRMGITEDKALHIGLIAKAKAKKVLQNKCVELELDRKDKGRFGRYLRYVRVDNLDYQSFMLKEGLAMSYCGDKTSSRYEYYNDLSRWKCD